MAAAASRDIVIKASPAEVMNVLLDLESLPDWSPVHDTVQILDRDDQGRPSRSREVVKVIGFSEEQVLRYTTHPDGVSWTLESATQQRTQDGRYTLTPVGDSTRVRFEFAVDLVMPVPGFFLKQGAKVIVDTATKGLRRRVLTVQSGRA